MSDIITIQKIRSTLDLLNTELHQYSKQGETAFSKFNSQITSNSAGIAIEATLNDLVGESCASMNSGKSLLENVLLKIRKELDLVNNVKDKITFLKEDLDIVGNKLGKQN